MPESRTIYTICIIPSRSLDFTQAPLSVASFDEFISCHDAMSISTDLIETVLGFMSGEIVVLSPVSGKITRFNKSIHKYPVTCLKWLPVLLFDSGLGFYFLCWLSRWKPVVF